VPRQQPVAPRAPVGSPVHVCSLEEADEVVVNINSHNHHTGRPRVVAANRLPDRYALVSCLGRVVDLARDYTGSRAVGQDMHRGPPRPVPNSEAAIVNTSIPASSRRALVRALRS
jgi:hypothetical protein